MGAYKACRLTTHACDFGSTTFHRREPIHNMNLLFAQCFLRAMPKRLGNNRKPESKLESVIRKRRYRSHGIKSTARDLPTTHESSSKEQHRRPRIYETVWPTAEGSSHCGEASSHCDMGLLELDFTGVG